VIPCIQNGRIDGNFASDRTLRIAGAFDGYGHRRFSKMRGPEATGAGHTGLQLAFRSDGPKLLLIFRAFGEHAKLQHSAGTIGEVH